MNTRMSAKRLLSAQTEADVTAFIDDLHRQYEIDWVPIGRQANNYGIVENQSAAPLASLTEIISNGIDAILRRRYRDLYSSEYQSSHDLTTYFDAAEALLEPEDEIRILAEGDKGGPVSLIVCDTGEGQPTDAFEDTFVGLLTPGLAKQNWPFLQGQFGMGRTAVLPHCGDRGYMAICTASMENPGVWTWTLVKKNHDGNAYEYLRIDGEVPTFEGEFQGESEFASRDVGSFLKLFNYALDNKSNITSRFRDNLARTVTDTPVHIQLVEKRDYESTTMQLPAVGLRTRMKRNKKYVDHDYTVTYDFGGRLGERDIHIGIFKSDAAIEDTDGLSKDSKRRLVTRKKQRNRAIFFTRNGQVHGDLGLSFIKNRCGRYHTAKDIVVFVEFSDFDSQDLTDLFMPSRDRLKDNDLSRRLMRGMESVIKTDDTIEEEEQRRREAFAKDKHDEKVDDMLKNLVDRNPALLDYLDTGKKVNTIDRTPEDSNDEEDEYTAPFVPDTFEIIKYKKGGAVTLWDETEDGPYEREMAVNRHGWARFLLNAPNDFFDRDLQQGEFRITPREVVRSYALSDGLISLQLEPLPGADPGDMIPVTAEVNAEGMDDPLRQRFRVVYTEEAEDSEETSDADDLPPLEQLDFPEVIPIEEDQWEEFPESFDADTPIRIEGREDNLTFYVNFDAAPLQNFLQRYNLRATGKETVSQTWKAGVTIYTLSTYIELQQEFSDDEVFTPTKVAEVSMKGVVQSMLDQHISHTELEELTV